MKTCIWCNKKEPSVTFHKKAHTFPQSLGGKSICENVCDLCNHFFGSPRNNSPAIEIVLKEMLNISKYILLYYFNDKQMINRYKSEYFNLNLNTNTIKLKPRYKIQKGYQARLGRLFRRGLYKVFLEEREKQKFDARESRFDFVREFARYDLGDYPIYYFKPKLDVVFYSEIDTTNPTIRFTEHSEKIDKEFKIFEYMIMGHYFGIPTSKYFNQLYINQYIKYLYEINNPFGIEIVPINYVEDIDYLFNYMK